VDAEQDFSEAGRTRNQKNETPSASISGGCHFGHIRHIQLVHKKDLDLVCQQAEIIFKNSKLLLSRSSLNVMYFPIVAIVPIQPGLPILEDFLLHLMDFSAAVAGK